MAANNHLPALTGLRFLAAVGVMAVHMPFLLNWPGLPTAVHKVLAEGHVGVPFFFCLSGFVLTHTYAERLASPGRRAIGRYLFARLARVWPLHLLVLVVAILFPIHAERLAWWQNLLEAGLVHFWVPDPLTRRGTNSVSWTLSVELFLYLALPLLLRAVRRWDGRPPAFWLCLAAVLAAAQAGLVRALEEASIEVAGWVCLTPPIHLFEFGMGVAVAKAWVGLRARGWVGTPAGRVGRTAATAGEVAVVALLIVLTLFHGKVSIFLRWCGYYTPAIGLVVLVFALQRGRLSRSLGWRPIAFLGEASFALYLVHVLVVHHGQVLLGDRLGPVALAGVTFALALAAACALHVGFEAPVRAWLLRGRRATATPAVGLRLPIMPFSRTR